MSPPEPLTFQRVHRASHAAGALFRWCTTTIVDALSEDTVLSTDLPEDKPLSSRAATPPSPPPKPAAPSPSRELAGALAAAKPPSPIPKPASPESVKLPPIVAEPVGKQSQPSAPRQATMWTPLPKPTEAPRPERKKPEVWKPDRHFELIANFDLGNCAITSDGEASMQTVAATVSMRNKLKLELVTSIDRIEHEALAASRLIAASDFFATNGLRPSVSEEERVAAHGDSPGVVCCLLLEDDRELGQYLINREAPDPDEDFKPSKQLLYILDWIESNFQTVKH